MFFRRSKIYEFDFIIIIIYHKAIMQKKLKLIEVSINNEKY